LVPSFSSIRHTSTSIGGTTRIPIYYDDDNDEESSTPLRDIIISELPPCIAITPVLSAKETKDSLIVGDNHLDTIPEKESNGFIKSSVENLVPNPSESEDLSHIGSECDVPVCDDFTTFFNLLFDADDNFFSSEDKPFSDEDVPKEIYSNPLFDKEIISIKIDPHHFNAESDLIESLLNQDSSIISFSIINSLLDEFVGKLIFLKSILPGIDEVDCGPEEEIRLIKKLFDSFMKEIGLSLTPNDSMPPGIENDDYDSEGDILILEELLSNDSLSLSENESFYFDVPSSPRPPAKPPDDDEIKPVKGILTIKMGVESSLHGPNWLFDIDALTKTMNYQPGVARSNDFSGEEDSTNNTNRVNTVTSNLNAASSSKVNVVGTNISINLSTDPNMPSLEDTGIFEESEDVFGAEADFYNFDSTFQTRRMLKNLEEHGLVGTVISRTDNKDLQNCLFACFLSQMKPKKVLQALKDPSLIEAMQEELPQFKFQDMDMKSAFLYGKIEKEVYVCQPPGFEDPDFSDKVYKVEKALYGLYQAPRAWVIGWCVLHTPSHGADPSTHFIIRVTGSVVVVGMCYVVDLIFSLTLLSTAVGGDRLYNVSLHELNSEPAFQAQLKLRNVSYLTKRIPFCIVSYGSYDFPPGRFGVLVAALSSKWAEIAVNRLERQWNWTGNANGTLRLCDGHDKWENGSENLFDGVTAAKLVAIRKRVSKLSFDKCVEDFEIIKRWWTAWDVPPAEELCRTVR
nr:hypothetical protein [Tanacetum cinerariifolium]